MANLQMQEVGHGVAFAIKVIPGSSKTAICGLIDGKLKMKVAAAPEKGKANQCLLAFLAKQLGVKKNVIRIMCGQKNTVKQVRVAGVNSDMLLKRLNLNK